MGAMERARQRMAEMARQEQQRKATEAAEARQRYRPEPGCRPVRECRWVFGGFALAAWAGFISLSLINNAGFWVQYVIAPYLSLAIALLVFTQGWIQLLFIGPGELLVKAYRKSIGHCRSALKAAAWLWAAVAFAEGIFLLLSHPSCWAPEVGFLSGCLGAGALTAIFDRRYARRMAYTLWDPEDPVL